MFHIIESQDWAQAQESNEYVPARYESEGFIHLSGRHQVLHPANLFYQGRENLLLLEIDAESLTSDLIYEPGSNGETQLFPHLYGPLNLDAVRVVHDFPCEVDGAFSLPATLAG